MSPVEWYAGRVDGLIVALDDMLANEAGPVNAQTLANFAREESAKLLEAIAQAPKPVPSSSTVTKTAPPTRNKVVRAAKAAKRKAVR